MTEIIHRLEEIPLGLRLDFVDDKPLYLPLSHLPCKALVRSLALAVLDKTNARGSIKTNWTARHYVASISRFAKWLDAQGFVGNLGDLTADHLYNYGQQERSKVERMTRTLLLAATRVAGVEHPVTSELLGHLEGSGVSTPDQRFTPLAPYTPGEYERIVEACKAEIEIWHQQGPWRLPTAKVTLAFRILIGLELGIPPESIDALRLEDLTWEGERDLRVSFRKRRADGPQTMRYRANGPWSGPRLIQRWVDASAPLRRKWTSGELWIWSPRENLVEVATFSVGPWQRHRRTILRSWGLHDDDGRQLMLDMRRLRKTWFARKSKFWHGAVTVDPNHSAQVEGDHYLTRSASREDIDMTIETAQQDLMRRAETVALVVADEEELADAVDNPSLIEERSQGASDTKWDMFAAACRDPFASPFSSKGTFCTATVWSCLVCPLAVITPTKLPALLRLEDYLREQSANVTHAEWLRVYGPAWVQLKTRIFPKFSEATFAEARRILETNSDLPVPIDPMEPV